jgi:16S rRNA (cytosine967-C5)-methyltransferase
MAQVSVNRSFEKQKYPRAIAVRVLTRVLSDHEPLDEVLASFSGEVSPDSLGWLQEACSGTLRWKGRLDGLLDSVSLKKKPSGWLRKVLLLACYQLVVQDRVHAGIVVSETVSEIKSKEGVAPANFANACLRKIAEHASFWRNQAFPKEQSTREGAQWASLPEWLWKKIVDQRGIEWATAYAQASLDRPKLWIRSKKAEWNPSWAESGPISSSWVSLEGSGGLTQRAGFDEGEFIVQDISSQMLISEVSSLVKKDLDSNELTALDLCAAPGGKSVGLAWSGFQLTATDRVARRVPLLKQTIARAAPEIRLVDWDEVKSSSSKDLVWVDAPCSGTGILRRHPDVRWLRQEKELPSLIQSQRELLRSAWDLVSPGGFLAYSVCSILQEEGTDAIVSVGLQGFKVKEWFLCPQSSPYGDGFWAILLKKPLSSLD